jgi:hypothetical protein
MKESSRGLSGRFVAAAASARFDVKVDVSVKPISVKPRPVIGSDAELISSDLRPKSKRSQGGKIQLKQDTFHMFHRKLYDKDNGLVRRAYLYIFEILGRTPLILESRP